MTTPLSLPSNKTISQHQVVSFPTQAASIGNMAIAIRNLNFYYNANTKALHNINLDIPRNRVTAMIGPSGSGKSTLLRSLNRIYEMHDGQFSEGQVMMNGQNILKIKDLTELRKQVGMVFQKPTPFPMSIFQNVAFALKHHEKLSRSALHDRVEDALHQAALWDEVKDKLNQSASNLSGGQQQRLCLARTLAMKPNILLLDEPTSALDPASTRKIEDVILKMKDNYTVVLVTHNLRQAQRVGDYVAFMRDGQLIEHNESQQLFSHPGEQATADYIRYA